MKAIGVAGMPGRRSTDDLVAAIRAAGANAYGFSLSDAVLDLDRDRAVCASLRVSDLDAIVVRKLGESTDPRTPAHINVLRYAERKGVRLFSRPSAIEEVNDRYRMTLRLADAGVPVPPTIIANTLEEASDVVERWGRVVLKPIFTSKGRGMIRLSRHEPYRLMLRRWARRHPGPFYLQRYVEHGGRDLGVAVLGGRALGAYYRVGRVGEWRTTVQLGGRYEAATPAPEIVALAEMVAALFELDYTVVDIVETPCGPLVYEASAFGGFGGLLAATGISAAKAYASYVLERLGEDR